MKNVVALILRLLVDTVLACLLFVGLCLICNIILDGVGGFKVWFTIISLGYGLSLYYEDISKFANIVRRHRMPR